eukprot:s1452_g6.t1
MPQSRFDQDGADVQLRGDDAPEAPFWHLPSVGWRTTDSSHRDVPGHEENVQRYEFSNEAVEPTSCAPAEQPMTERCMAQTDLLCGTSFAVTLVVSGESDSDGMNWLDGYTEYCLADVPSMMWREMLTGASHSLAADFSHHLDGKKFQCIRRCCLRLVSKKWFDYMMGLIIFANAISVGYEIQASLTQVETWMYWLDSVFAAWRESVLGVQVAVTGFRFDSKAPRKLKPSVTPIALCQLGHDRIMNAVCLYPACLHIARNAMQLASFAAHITS